MIRAKSNFTSATSPDAGAVHHHDLSGKTATVFMDADKVSIAIALTAYVTDGPKVQYEAHADERRSSQSAFTLRI